MLHIPIVIVYNIHVFPMWTVSHSLPISSARSLYLTLDADPINGCEKMCECILLARFKLTFNIFGKERKVPKALRMRNKWEKKNWKKWKRQYLRWKCAVCQTVWLILMCVGAVDSTKFNGWELFYLSTGLLAGIRTSVADGDWYHHTQIRALSTQ